MSINHCMHGWFNIGHDAMPGCDDLVGRVYRLGMELPDKVDCMSLGHSPRLLERPCILE